MTASRPTWLVTGGSGFLGRHLLDRLEREPVDIVAIGRRPRLARPGVRLVLADLLDRDRLAEAIAEAAPSVVFHLAGLTPPADPEALDRANRLATLNLLDALRPLAGTTRLVVAGSAAEIGPVPVDLLPIGEDVPCRPDGAYGRSKLGATEAALAAGAIVARVFNPIGPGLPTNQALGRFAAILAGGDGPARLEVGDLSPRRDFVDVRDVADALVALAARGEAGLYHVGTGVSRSVGQGLDALIRLSGRPVRLAAGPARPSGPLDSRADIARIRAGPGWSPRIGFDRSLADLWAAARAAG